MGRGVLRPDLAATHFRLDRHPPSDALAPFVDYYWIPRWDLRGKPPYEQTILPHPNVHLVFEASGTGIFGVDRKLFTRSLSGVGLAFGVRFTAGGCRPFWQAPISQPRRRHHPVGRLRDRRLPERPEPAGREPHPERQPHAGKRAGEQLAVDAEYPG